MNVKILGLTLFFKTFCSNISIELCFHQVHDLSSFNDKHISFSRNHSKYIRIREKAQVDKGILNQIFLSDYLLFSIFNFFWRRIIKSQEILSNCNELIIIVSVGCYFSNLVWQFTNSGDLILFLLVNSIVSYLRSTSLIRSSQCDQVSSIDL